MVCCVWLGAGASWGSIAKRESSLQALNQKPDEPPIRVVLQGFLPPHYP